MLPIALSSCQEMLQLVKFFMSGCGWRKRAGQVKTFVIAGCGRCVPLCNTLSQEQLVPWFQVVFPVHGEPIQCAVAGSRWEGSHSNNSGV